LTDLLAATVNRPPLHPADILSALADIRVRAGRATEIVQDEHRIDVKAFVRFFVDLHKRREGVGPTPPSEEARRGPSAHLRSGS
jgi:hypothetical protein